MKSAKIFTVMVLVAALLAGMALSGCEILSRYTAEPEEPVVEEVEEPVQAEVPPPVVEEPDIDIWKQRLTTWPIGFGFADEKGSRLIVVNYDFTGETEEDGAVQPEPVTTETEGEEPPEEPAEYPAAEGFDPDIYSLAIGPYGDIFPIAFDAWQDEARGNSGRETARNFDNLPGYVYSQADWKLANNTTYLLTNMGPLVDAMIKITAPGWRGNTPSMEEETLESIARYKNREIVWGKTLAVTKDDGLIGIVLFEREGDEMLFSIVYMDEEKTVFWDNYAVYDEMSTWRVDMGEEPGSFKPILLAGFDEGLLLVLTWSAPEGEGIVVLYEEDGAFVQSEDISFARYMSPY